VNAAPTRPILELDNLSASYGQSEALKPSTLHVTRGEIVVVLGPNGAGKSTMMRAIMGLIRTRGALRLDGRDIAQLSTQQRAAAGLTLVPEGRGILGPLTAMENLELGAYSRYGRVPRQAIRESLDRVFELFPRLAQRRKQKAGLMSGGEQQMLAVGRALMATPSLLLLDEPSLGLAPRVAQEILKSLAALNKNGLSILLVEQKAPLALEIAARAYVLRNGKVVAAMKTSEISGADALAELYLGA
jgi:branched-chain amino acid transport system ATP-binding protein